MTKLLYFLDLITNQFDLVQANFSWRRIEADSRI